MTFLIVGRHDNARDVASWLANELGYEKVWPVRVRAMSPKSNKNTVICYGAEYYRPEYGKNWLYLLLSKDELEQAYKNKHYYTRDGRDWYITDYTDKGSLSEQYSEYHPFGHHVGMTVWDVNGSLDTDIWGRPKEKPYPRVRLFVTRLEV